MRSTLLALTLLLVAGCGRSRVVGPGTDGAGPEQGTADARVEQVRADGHAGEARPPDLPLWPDLPRPDQYVGAPFGCVSAADCFGLQCCSTPWGVKLCAATCGP